MQAALLISLLWKRDTTRSISDEVRRRPASHFAKWSKPIPQVLKLTILERAVSLRPNSAAAQYNLGLAQLKEKKFEEAIASNKKALELKPEWPDAYNNLGLAYAGLNRWNEAVTAYGEAVRLVPNYAGALYNLGHAYLSLGQKSKTYEVIDKVKPLNWDLQAHLWQEILAIDHPASVAAAPAPTQPPPAETSPPPAPDGSGSSTTSAD